MTPKLVAYLDQSVGQPAEGPGAIPNPSVSWDGITLVLTPALIAAITDKGGRVYEVKAYGADSTGGADSTAAYNAAVAALGASPGVVLFSYGRYKMAGPTTPITHPGQYVVGMGITATTILDYQGSAGDLFRFYNTLSAGYGGGIKGLTIDGSNAAAGCAGLHLGDMYLAELDILVRAYSGTSSIGVHFDNTIWWTEGLRGNLYVSNCTQGVVFDVSGATTSTRSFAYMDLTIQVNMAVGQDGVVLQNGAYIDNGRLHIKGNAVTSASVQNSAFLRITGTVPGSHPLANSYAAIANGNLDMQCEVDGVDAHGPYSIFFGAFSGTNENLIGPCYGVLNFEGTYTGCNANPINSNFGVVTYIGPVIESVLNVNGAASGPLASIGNMNLIDGAYYYTLAGMNGANGNTFTSFGDFMSCTLSASITINLQAVAGLQRKTIIIKQAAAGGPFTVTWPHNAVPTTSAPKVVWAGGSAPTMSAGANAVDVYKLETTDGATWYGQAIQNVS